MEKRLTTMDAAKFRIILACNIVILLAIFAGGFLFFRGQLDAYANQVKTDNYAAVVSSSDVDRLQELQQELKNDKVAVTRAQNIVADSQYYQYQNQIISDLNQYAKTSGVTITSYDFGAASTSKSPAPAQAPNPLTATPPGIKTISAVISVKSPVKYTAIMRFIHSIELNLTKMQLAGISIVKASNSSDVTVNPLTVEVYTR